MTASDLRSIRPAVALDAPRRRRARRGRIGASREFRTLVAEFDGRRGAGREQAAGPSDTPVRPRHVIAAEAILARVRERLAAPETATGRAVRRADERPASDGIGPVHALRGAKRVVLGGLDQLDHRLQKVLRRRGFDAVEVAGVAEAAMASVPRRAEIALNHLPLAPRPMEAAKHLFEAALDRIAENLARALARHGLGRDRIAEISHLTMIDLDERVAAALDALADGWTRTRGAAGAA